MDYVIEQGLKDALKSEIALLNQSLEDHCKSIDGFLGELLSYVLINSGKRIRPVLVILGSHLGKADVEQVRILEMAVELVHIATLIHDDVIDKAALRRGRKTVVDEHGVDTAVLLGDYVYTLAFLKVSELGNPLLLQLLMKATSVMCDGEIEQLKNRFQFSLSEDDYFLFIQKKTASLFGASIRSGAILAEQDLKTQTALESYGVNLGMAFQITDDLLDVTGDEVVVGKTLRTDLISGKMTLPLIHYRNSIHSTSEYDELMENLKNPDHHIAGLIERMKNAGSIQYSEGVAKKYVLQALDCLEEMPNGTPRDQLESLAKILLARKA